MVERLVANDINEVVRLRLRRLTSRKTCEKVLHRRHDALDNEMIRKKADGLAWLVRSMLGYWQADRQEHCTERAYSLSLLCTLTSNHC